MDIKWSVSGTNEHFEKKTLMNKASRLIVKINYYMIYQQKQLTNFNGYESENYGCTVPKIKNSANLTIYVGNLQGTEQKWIKLTK